MKFKILSLFLVSISLLACKEQEKNQQIDIEYSSGISKEKDSITPPRETALPKRQCYLYAKNKDTITLNLEQTNNRITGDLAYLWAEKDQNLGSITGIRKGDTIFADYRFTSEGKESIREVVFLKKNDQLLEGAAPVTKRDGKTVFKNSQFNFGSSVVLTRTDCIM